MTKKGFIVSLVFVFFSVTTHAQNYSEIKTGLMWVEDHPFFYSESLSDDYYLRTPSIVSYDEASDSISVNNYLKGYYIYENVLEESNLLKENVEDYIDDILVNIKLLGDFNKLKTEKKGIKLNKTWIYSLAIVTYQDLYLGRFKRLVPDFSSSKDLILKYDDLEIPIYYIKIINIEPYR